MGLQSGRLCTINVVAEVTLISNAALLGWNIPSKLCFYKNGPNVIEDPNGICMCSRLARSTPHINKVMDGRFYVYQHP